MLKFAGTGAAILVIFKLILRRFQNVTMYIS
jgi:hypothetical protein